MRRRYATLLLTGVGLGCATARSDVAVQIQAPTFVAPKALLRRVSQISVDIAQDGSGVSCDEGTGQIVGGGGSLVQYVAGTACTDGSPYCLDVDLGPSPSQYVVAARGTEANGELYVTGCAKIDISRDKAVSIILKRAALNNTCGDQIVQYGEQCEAPGTRPLSCAADCTSMPFQLAAGVTGANALLSSSWAPGNSPFLASYLDGGEGGTILCDAALDADFERQTLSGPFVTGKGCVSLPSAAKSAQLLRTASGFRSLYLTNGSSPRLSTAQYTASLSPADSGQTVSNGSGGAEGPFSASVSGDSVFAVWVNGSGNLAGRSISTGSLGPQRSYAETGDVNTPKIVAWRDGWVLVWESSGSIRLRLLAADGTPRGTDVRVNASTLTAASSKPDVASLSDGRFVVVWESGGAVWSQRYGANGGAEADNQLAPLHENRTGTRSDVHVSAGQGSTPFFMATWVKDNGIEGRLLSPTSGYLLNSVDGTDNEFAVVQPDATARRMPMSATGGSGPTTGVVWLQSDGLYGRRFPTPSR